MVSSLSVPERFRVKVCQNKHCNKMGGGKSLIRNLEHLTYNPSSKNSFEIEPTGCLSGCGKGPNVEISSNVRSSIIFHGISDNDAIKSMLETFGVCVPSLLIAASNIMSRADKTLKIEEKEKLLTSVISALEKDEVLGQSSATLSSCLVKRADARLMLSTPNIEGSITDIKRAASIRPNDSLIWRIMAEAEEMRGNVNAAIEAMSTCAELDSSFQAKASNEITRLRRMKP